MTREELNNLLLINSSYGALMNNTAVCDGYVNLMRLLLSMCNIESEKVDCNIENDENLFKSHAAIRVKMRDQWYYADPEREQTCDEKTFFALLDIDIGYLGVRMNYFFRWIVCADCHKDLPAERGKLIDDGGYVNRFIELIEITVNEERTLVNLIGGIKITNVIDKTICAVYVELVAFLDELRAVIEREVYAARFKINCDAVISDKICVANVAHRIVFFIGFDICANYEAPVINSVGIVFYAAVTDQLSHKVENKVGVTAAKEADGGNEVEVCIKGGGGRDVQVFKFHNYLLLALNFYLRAQRVLRKDYNTFVQKD